MQQDVFLMALKRLPKEVDWNSLQIFTGDAILIRDQLKNYLLNHQGNHAYAARVIARFGLQDQFSFVSSRNIELKMFVNDRYFSLLGRGTKTDGSEQSKYERSY